MTDREDLRPSGSPSVRIESGHVVGPLTDPESGIAAFRGIPYAAPPMGELRWKPPQHVDSWDGERPCIEYGPACPQPGRFFSDILVRETPARESEDCLYLNVWTVIGDDEARPVMVWLHGGGFISGWGHQRDFEGTALVRKAWSWLRSTTVWDRSDSSHTRLYRRSPRAEFPATMDSWTRSRHCAGYGPTSPRSVATRTA